MVKAFDDRELLLRAVWPADRRPDFWKNGLLSSAALKDKKGLSVDRTDDRPTEEAVEQMTKKFQGTIVSFTVPACNAVQACLRHKPSRGNPYHSEIHGSETEIELNDLQAFKLARQAKVEFQPGLK